mgnify:FL=1
MSKEKLIENIKTLSQQEISYLSYVDGRIADVCMNNNRLNTHYDEWRITREWIHGYLGRSFSGNLQRANKYFTEPDRLLRVLSIMTTRFYYPIQALRVLKKALEDNSATPAMLAFFLRAIRRREDYKNVFEGYINKPKFNVGQMVQLRANIGVDAVIEKQKHRSPSFRSCSRWSLAEARKKTFMVLSSDPPIEGRVFAKKYSYHEKQGGCRYYKLLPIGEAKTYLVTEKFLKECRTKAVKDARK